MARSQKPENGNLPPRNHFYAAASINEERSKMQVTTEESTRPKPINDVAPNSDRNLKSPSAKPMTTQSSRKNRWWQNWQFWGILLILCSGGIGYTATTMLLRLPKTQSCSTVFWPVASASVRLYCAQNLADQNTVESLLEAIALVEELPENHPLRNEINRSVEKWANAILNIGEAKFQEGNLEVATAIAQQIPTNVEAYSLVESKIADWNQIWSEATENYAKVEDNLRKAQWSNAFSWAVRLTDSKNDYWATTKYSESIDNINLAQEETITLDKAATQLSDGSIDSLLDGINQATEIPEDSYTYDNAQKIITEGKTKLLAKIDNLIAQQKWSELQRATYSIPDVLDLQPQVKDWQIIANAGKSASLDTVLGLEDAIAEAEKLSEDSPLYDKGQQLIQRWQSEIQDVRHLARAEELARPGNINAYNAAIVEVSLIPANNPRYREAQQKIKKWRGEIQIIEDRPIINKAKELALPGDIAAWRRAIAEIELVSSSSPLYSEAQKNARTWQTNIEREEDQPILEQAITLGNEGEYQQAIAIAEPISKGRALSRQAQEKITLWRKEIRGKEYLREAHYLASQNTADSLARAILVIRQIPTDTTEHYKVVPSINEWSRQIFAMAERTSYRSLRDAIEIAEKIPSGTAAHSEAQIQIERWQNRLNPQPLIQKREKTNSEFQLEKERKD